MNSHLILKMSNFLVNTLILISILTIIILFLFLVGLSDRNVDLIIELNAQMQIQKRTEFYSILINILIVIISIAFPLSISVISGATTPRLRSKLADYFKNEMEFKIMMILIPILSMLLVLQGFFGPNNVINIVTLTVGLVALFNMRNFIKVVFKYSADFKNVVKRKVQFKIDEII